MKRRTKLRGRTMRAGIAYALVALFCGLFLAAARGAPQAQGFIVLASAAMAAAVYLQNRRTGFGPLGDAATRIGVNVLAVVPAISPRALRRLPPDERSPAGFLVEQPTSPFSAGFRELGKHLATVARRREARVVAISAVLGGDGATTTSLCLAQTLALSGVRALLIDCDLRGRELTKLLDLPAAAGVLEVVAGDEHWEAAIASGQGRGFDVLPAGRQGPGARDLFSEPAFRQMLEAMKRDYNFIVLDCPPILNSVEGRMLARAAEGTVLVVRWGKTPARAIRSALTSLRRIGVQEIAGLFVTEGPRTTTAP
jgi:Mrp family chromosome partitioning ATPase